MPAIPNDSTSQQVYDFVVDHLRKQGGPATDSGDNCLYRSPEGRKCAAGCLLTDEEYKPSMEGVDIETLSTSRPGMPSLFQSHSFLLLNLQNCHDDSRSHLYDLATGHKVFDMLKLEANLKGAANASDLTYKEPPNASNNESK